MKAVAAVLALSAASALAGPTHVKRAGTLTDSSKTPQVTVKGNAFFAGNNRFYIRGLDYQPGGSSALEDPIAEPEVCKRDIEKFKDLGINTVRIYTVDNSMNHDECMQALADAGIYLALDVNSPHYSINRADPHPSYNDVYLQSVFATIDAFAGYDNTLLFFSANEVINDNTTTGAAKYVKAVTRDMRQYIRARKYRSIPVGYSAADVEENRFESAQYFNCGDDDSRSDFFAFNDYSWCDPSSYTTSGWDQKVAQYGNYSIPLFLSEYGCNKGERQWQEVASLYGTDMTPVYSGGLVYEYSEEGSNYGIVTITGNTVTEDTDYAPLKAAFSNTPSPSGDGGYKTDLPPQPCPAVVPGAWESDDNLPAMPEPAKKYMQEGAGTPPGLNGDGSQNHGTPSSSTASPGVSNGVSGSAGSASSTAAAASLRVPELSAAPLVCGAISVIGMLVGASLL